MTGHKHKSRRINEEKTNFTMGINWRHTGKREKDGLLQTKILKRDKYGPNQQTTLVLVKWTY